MEYKTNVNYLLMAERFDRIGGGSSEGLPADCYHSHSKNKPSGYHKIPDADGGTVGEILEPPL